MISTLAMKQCTENWACLLLFLDVNVTDIIDVYTEDTIEAINK